MKKLVIIIVILLLILIGMIIYRNTAIKSNNQVNVQDVEKIETYITKIYMWKEVTSEALPTFENINEVSDIWIWEAVKKNLENYELTYDEIQNKAKELFGPDFTKEFPREGTENLTYNPETDKYYATGMGLDQEEDCFLLNNIQKTETGYEVEIVEYLEDYSQESAENEGVQENITEQGNLGTEEAVNEQSYQIVIRNLNDEEIGKVEESQESSSQDIVKNNIDRFTRKIVTLKQEGDNLYVQKVSNKV